MRPSSVSPFPGLSIPRPVCAAAGVLSALVLLPPVLASDQPFLWWVEGGTPDFPWFRSLLNPNLYPSRLELACNTLLLVLPVLLIAMRGATHRGAPVWRLAGGALVVFLCLGGVQVRPLQAPLVDYHAAQARLEAEGTPVRALWSPVPWGYARSDSASVAAPPSLEHPLGTGTDGRDYLARWAHGSRRSVLVGLLAVLLGTAVGTVVGALSGYFGGYADRVLHRVITLGVALPAMLVVVAMAGLLGAGSTLSLVLVLAMVAWVQPARLVRARCLELRSAPWVQAARATGHPESGILLQDVLPAAVGPVLAGLPLWVASCIVVEVSFGYLGLGSPHVPSWGRLLYAGALADRSLLVLFPAASIFGTMLLLHAAGRSLERAIEPRRRC